jgi:hypothetical protein
VGSHVPHTVEHPKADVASSLVHSTVIIPGTIVFGFLTFIFNMFIRVLIISYFFKICITFQYFQIIVYVYFFTLLGPSESLSLPNDSRFSAPPHSKAFTFSFMCLYSNLICQLELSGLKEKSSFNRSAAVKCTLSQYIYSTLNCTPVHHSAWKIKLWGRFSRQSSWLIAGQVVSLNLIVES